ncbi:ABC transporter substrate-binding protein [Streptomyces geranii]|uniref:ABC transporter substrate-binding protein n=1 Tax=Streptomyces geranii TaxID=2058923 RepID=UPI000D02FB5A|nr:extracellular solute-binding protein [Streptomyces geranii]
MNRKQGRVAAATAAALSVVLAGCSSGNNTAAGSDGPVTIEMWGWGETQYTQPIVDKFNSTHTDIKLKYVKQADDTSTAANVRNAVAAGKGVPCLVQNWGGAEVPSLAAEGLLADVTEYVEPYVEKGVFNKAAPAGAQAGGKYYGVPSGSQPSFMLINRAVYDKYGVDVPKTWDDVITAGKTLKKHGVYVMNMAGEDPSTLVGLVQQAGGSWYGIDGDSWKVDFLSPESLKAADVVQQLVDNDLVANQTYMDKPALIKYFDSGKMVSLVTQVWQLGAYEIDYKKSLGDWQAIDLPQFSDATQFTTMAHGAAELIPKGCEHLKEAVEASVWKMTSKDAINASYNSQTKSYSWPGAIPDPSPWVDSAVPSKLFGTHKSETKEVILKSVKAGRDSWVVGPNYTGVFAELQDQWAQVAAKKITVREALEHMQKFTVDDLKSKNINVES